MVMSRKVGMGSFAAIIFVALALWGGNSTPAFAETVIRTGGTGFGLGIMNILAGSYEKNHPGVRVEILPSLGSSGGIKALLQGTIDFSVSGRPPRDEDVSQGGNAVELVRTPFVFIVNAKTRKSDITGVELEKIYSGVMSVWPDGSRIRLVLRPKTETDTKIVESLSPAMERAVASAQSREGMILAVTDQESTDTVEKTPGALGGSTLMQVLAERKRVNILRFNGVEPSVAGIRDGSYPLVKTLYLVTSPKTSPEARQFIEFVRSKKGESILREYGGMPVNAR